MSVTSGYLRLPNGSNRIALWRCPQRCDFQYAGLHEGSEETCAKHLEEVHRFTPEEAQELLQRFVVVRYGGERP